MIDADRVTLNEVIETRRSIRSYKPGKIEFSDIGEIIKTAQQAPSWKNSQTGRYYAVCSEDILSKVKSECLPEYNQKNCADASALVVTTFKKNISGFGSDSEPANELGNEWGAYDLGLQAQLLILKARALGYDTLIMGIRDSEAVRRLLSIPEDEEVVSVISLGYRDIEPTAPKRKELDEILKIF